MKHFVLNPYTAGIIHNNDDNTKITISGWNNKWRKLEKGEIILLSTSNSPDTASSYKVVKNNSPLKPKDQFFIDLEWIAKKDINVTDTNNK